jgi:hypothetical protein
MVFLYLRIRHKDDWYDTERKKDLVGYLSCVVTALHPLLRHYDTDNILTQRKTA